MDVEKVKADAVALRKQASLLAASIRAQLQRERMARVRTARLAKGLCPVCGKVKTAEDVTYRCAICNHKATERQAAHRGRIKGRYEWPI